MDLNKCYLGSCYSLIKQVADKSIDLIVTDPPYDFNGLLPSSFSYSSKLNDFNLVSGFDYSILDEFIRVMKKINIYIWCNKEQINIYLNYFLRFGCNFEIFCLCKNNPVPLYHNHFLKDKEYCLYFWDRSVKLNLDYNSAFTFYTLNVSKSSFDHPCVKPYFIISNMIKVSSSVGDVVLDCFAGTGTTLVAAKDLNRRFLGFEIVPKYHSICLERLFSNKQLTLF